MTLPLDDNLAALALVDPSSLAWARQPPPAEGLRVDGRDADLRLVTGDGRSLRLHSARDPRREADAQVSQALGERATSVVAVVGAGAGFVLEALESRPETSILVLEPTRDLAFAWLARRSWRGLIDSGRIRLLVGPLYAGSAGASQFLGAAWTHLAVVVNPVLMREAPADVARARAVLDRAAREALQNANARTRFEDLAFRNTLANLVPLLREADAAGLSGAFSGRPAIVVGAGPSLDVNVAALRPLQSSCVIVAADTAVVPCLKGGVTPHLAVALDPSADNARHLTRTALPDSIHLVCEASIDPSVPEAFPGRTFFFRVGRHAPWPWLASAGIDLGVLEAWGSVVTSALDLAVRAGCSPIVFAGLDLAFTGGRPYCRHTPLDDGWARSVGVGHRLEDLWDLFLEARPIVLERGVDGSDVRTAAHLVAFRDWLRDYAAARSHVRFLNGTGGGILHGTSVEPISLSEAAIALQPPSGADVAGAVTRLWTASRRPDRTTSVLARLSAAAARDLLDGHSAAHAAAADLDVAEVSKALDARAARPVVVTPTSPSAEAWRVTTTETACWLPDAARVLRLLDPDRLATFTDAVPADPTRARASLVRAFDAMHAACAALRTTPPEAIPTANRDIWGDVPAAAQIAWPRHVRPAVDAAAAALDDALRHGWPTRLCRPSSYFMASPDPRAEGTVTALSATELVLSPAQEGLNALAVQWARVASAVCSPDSPIGRCVESLRASRPPLLRGPRARTGLRTWLAPPEPSSASTADRPIVPFLPDYALMRAKTGLLTLDPRFVPPTARVPRSPLPFCLFALPHAWAPATDRLPAADIPWSTMLEPLVLTTRGLGACRLAARLDDALALVTQVDGSGCHVVDADGAVRQGEGWPRRIDGEIAVGERGRLAWSWDGARHLLFRPHPGAAPSVWEIPIAPMHAIEDDDASALVATGSGLWRWRESTGLEPVAPGPALVALHRDGAGVRAYPHPVIREDGTRVAIDRAFDWAEAQTSCTEHGIAPGDACLSRSVQGPWTADALMDHSAVRIAHRSGATFWLACSGPRSVAWAGASLVVTLISGDALLFPQLLAAVEPLAGPWPTAPPTEPGPRR